MYAIVAVKEGDDRGRSDSTMGPTTILRLSKPWARTQKIIKYI